MKFYKYGCGCIGSPPEHGLGTLDDTKSCMCLVVVRCDGNGYDHEIEFRKGTMTEAKIKEGHFLGEEEAEELTQEIASLVHDGYNMREMRCLIGK